MKSNLKSTCATFDWFCRGGAHILASETEIKLSPPSRAYSTATKDLTTMYVHCMSQWNRLDKFCNLFRNHLISDISYLINVFVIFKRTRHTFTPNHIISLRNNLEYILCKHKSNLDIWLGSSPHRISLELRTSYSLSHWSNTK